MLRRAGLDVRVGVLEKECLELNKCFITVQTKKRPYIILKWAQSADGYIDCLRDKSEKACVISDAVTSALVHRMRSLYDAILVGRKTAEMDNPSLTVRYWTGDNPLRVVIDKDLSLPRNLRLYRWDKDFGIYFREACPGRRGRIYNNRFFKTGGSGNITVLV